MARIRDPKDLARLESERYRNNLQYAIAEMKEKTEQNKLDHERELNNSPEAQMMRWIQMRGEIQKANPHAPPADVDMRMQELAKRFNVSGPQPGNVNPPGNNGVEATQKQQEANWAYRQLITYDRSTGQPSINEEALARLEELYDNGRGKYITDQSLSELRDLMINAGLDPRILNFTTEAENRREMQEAFRRSVAQTLGKLDEPKQPPPKAVKKQEKRNPWRFLGNFWPPGPSPGPVLGSNR